MADNNKLIIEIGSKLAGDFGQAFQSAKTQITAVTEELVELKKQQQRIKRFDLDVSAVEKARVAFRQAQDEVMRLRLEVKKNPAKALERDLAKAERQAAKLNATLVKQRGKLDDSGRALRAVGLSAVNTAAQYARLDAAIKQVTARGQRLKQLQAQQEALSQSSARLRTQLLAGSAVMGTLAVGLATTTGKVLELNRELLNTEQKLGVSAQALQVWGLGAQKVGLSSEKMSDILKDVSDKLGDLAATGGGEAKDVFETLNLNIKDFQNLKPHEALQQIIDRMQSMKDLSQHQRVFLLESLADEASALYPLLKDSGAELAKVKALAEASGAIISKEDSATLTAAHEQLTEIKRVTQGLQTQTGLLGAAFLNAFGADLTAGIQALSHGLQDARDDLPALIQAITTLGTVLVTAKVASIAFNQAQLLATRGSLAWKTAKDQAARSTTAYTGRLRVLNTVLPATTLAARGLAGVMALLGGPAGVVVLAGSALYQLAQHLKTTNTLEYQAAQAAAHHSTAMSRAKAMILEYANASPALQQSLVAEKEHMLANAKVAIQLAQSQITALTARLNLVKQLENNSNGSIKDGTKLVGDTQSKAHQAAIEKQQALLKQHKAEFTELEQELSKLGKTTAKVTQQTEPLVQATGKLSKTQKDNSDITKLTSAAFKEEQKALKQAVIAKTEGAEAAYRYQLKQKGVTAEEIKQLVELKRKSGAFDEAKGKQKQLTATGEAYQQQQQQITDSLKSSNKALTLAQIEHDQGKAAAERHKLVLAGFNEEQIKEKLATDQAATALQNNIQKREQASQAMDAVRKSLKLATLEHDQGKAATERHKLASEGFTSAQIAEKQASDARIKSMQEAIQKREQVSQAMDAVRESLKLTTLEHDLGKAAAERHKLASEGFTSAQVAEKQAADARIKSMQEAIQKREQVIEGLKSARRELQLQTLERTKGKRAADLQRLALQGYNDVQAKEKILLDQAIEKTKNLNRQRAQITAQLKKSRRELALQNLERTKGKRATDVQRLALQGYNKVQAAEQLQLNAAIEKTKALNQLRQQAKKNVEQLTEKHELQRIKLTEGSAAAELYQLKIQGYSEELATAKMQLEANIEAMQRMENVTDGLGEALVNGLLSGDWKSAGQQLMGLLNQNIVAPMQKQLSGAFSQFMGGGGTGGFSNILSTVTGGGLTGAMAAGGLGMMAGQMLGQTGIGTGIGAGIGNMILPGLGGLIGGGLGGLVESLFGFGEKQKIKGVFGQFSDTVQATTSVSNDRRDERVFYQTRRSEREFHRTSDFGQFGILSGRSQSIGRDSEDQIPAIHAALDSMKALDDAFVAFLPSGEAGEQQITRTAQALDGFEMSALNTQELLKKRTVAIYHSMSREMQQALQGLDGGFTRLPIEKMAARIEYLGVVSQQVQPVMTQLGFQLSRTWDGALRDATRLTDAMGGLEQTSQGLQSVYQNLMTEQERNSQGFTQARDHIMGLNQSLGLTGQQMITTRAGLLEYIRGLDLSNSKNAELAAQAINAAGAMGTFAGAIEGIQGMFANTLAQIENDLLSQQEKVSKYMTEAQSLFEQLQAESDPGRIAEISEQINSAVSNAWSNMTEDQRAANADYLRTMLTSSSELAAEQLKAGMGNAELMRDAIQAMAEPVADLSGTATEMQQAGSGMTTAAAGMNTAASAMASAAANIPREITANVYSTVKVEGVPTDPDGSHFTGLKSVPFDGYIGELHKNEMVLPANDAHYLRQGEPVQLQNDKVVPIRNTALQAKVARLTQQVQPARNTHLTQQTYHTDTTPATVPVQITINAAAGQDPRSIAREVERVLQRHKQQEQRRQRNLNMERLA